jgi:hypothetical protein
MYTIARSIRRRENLVSIVQIANAGLSPTTKNDIVTLGKAAPGGDGRHNQQAELSMSNWFSLLFMLGLIAFSYWLLVWRIPMK